MLATFYSPAGYSNVRSDSVSDLDFAITGALHSVFSLNIFSILEKAGVGKRSNEGFNIETFANEY